MHLRQDKSRVLKYCRSSSTFRWKSSRKTRQSNRFTSLISNPGVWAIAVKKHDCDSASELPILFRYKRGSVMPWMTVLERADKAECFLAWMPIYLSCSSWASFSSNIDAMMEDTYDAFRRKNIKLSWVLPTDEIESDMVAQRGKSYPACSCSSFPY